MELQKIADLTAGRPDIKCDLENGLICIIDRGFWSPVDLWRAKPEIEGRKIIGVECLYQAIKLTFEYGPPLEVAIFKYFRNTNIYGHPLSSILGNVVGVLNYNWSGADALIFTNVVYQLIGPDKITYFDRNYDKLYCRPKIGFNITQAVITGQFHNVTIVNYKYAFENATVVDHAINLEGRTYYLTTTAEIDKIELLTDAKTVRYKNLCHHLLSQFELKTETKNGRIYFEDKYIKFVKNSTFYKFGGVYLMEDSTGRIREIFPSYVARPMLTKAAIRQSEPNNDDFAKN